MRLQPNPKRWARWFAWYPVIVGDTDEVVWWEHVERFPFWNYRGQWSPFYRSIGSSYLQGIEPPSYPERASFGRPVGGASQGRLA